MLLRKTQCRLSDNEAESCLIARDFIAGKLHNARWVLERATRDHALRVDTDRLKGVSMELASAARRAAGITCLEEFGA